MCIRDSPYPTPPPPNPVPPTGGQKIDNKGCDSQGGSPAPDLSVAGSGCLNVTVTPQVETLKGAISPTPPALGAGLYADVAFSNSSNTIQLTGGTYNINSLSLGSGVTLQITGCPVILNIAGNGVPPSQAVFDTSSGAVANSFAPSCFQIVYGGTGLIKLAGGASTAGVVYAPKASITLTGGGTWNGAIVGDNVTVSGGTAVNYDRALGSAFYIAGNYVPMGFSWSSF